MKRPSFQFYPSDWLRDTALRTCSLGARGLWIDMICFMHEGSPYGHLKVGNKVILPSNLASMSGTTLIDIEGWLDELKQAGVYDIAEDGSICSRRMIRDENLRNMRAAGGKLGGNPALKVDEKVNHKVKQKPTPSSSSASSSSNKYINGGFQNFWNAWPKNDRKQDKRKCLAKWESDKLDEHLKIILADIELKKLSDKWMTGYIEAPLVYLNNRRWEDGTAQELEEENRWSTRKGVEEIAVQIGLEPWNQLEQWDVYLRTVRTHYDKNHSARAH